MGDALHPVSALDLRAAAHLGFLAPGDTVLRSGQETWVAAGSLRWLFKPRRKLP